MKRTCTRCEVDRDEDDYYSYKSGLKFRICKDCVKKASRERSARERSKRRRIQETKPKATRECVHCSTSFEPRRKDQKYCTIKCKRRNSEQRRNRQALVEHPIVQCAKCGKLFTRRTTLHRFCSPRCKDYVNSGDNRQRSRRYGTTYVFVSKADIFERDGWECGICHQPIDRTLSYPHPQSVSLDHKTPLSRGGAHHPKNLQATHLRCNIRKKDRVELESRAPAKS